MEPTVATIYSCLGNLIFGEEDDELEDAVIRLLAERRQTLAVAEWGTGGLIADWLSEASSADIFLGGFIVSSDAARRELLDSLGQLPVGGSAIDETVAALAPRCPEPPCRRLRPGYW